MEYMESKMQQHMEAGQAIADELHELSNKFEIWASTNEILDTNFMSAFDFDIYEFTYTNSEINKLWLSFKAGAGF